MRRRLPLRHPFHYAVLSIAFGYSIHNIIISIGHSSPGSQESIEKAVVSNASTRNAVTNQNSRYQEGLYRRYSPLEQMFKPAGLLLEDNSVAACMFGKRGMHFPHAFQELTRCVSWWRASTANVINTSKQAVLTFFRKGSYTKFKQSSWAKDFVQVLQAQPPFHLWLDQNFTYSSMSVQGALPNVQDIYMQTTKSVPPAFEMAHPQDAEELRTVIWRHYSITRTTRKGGCKDSKSRPIIGFLNRKPSSGRHVVNYQATLDSLSVAFGRKDDPIDYLESFDGMSFQEQVTYMSNIDILISPHGAQVTNTAFLPTCGGVLELFPKGYWAPHYFGTLARATGHYHFSIYSDDHNKKNEDVSYYMTTSFETRTLARTFNVTVTDMKGVVDATKALVDRWIQCCRYGLVH